jgi:hypothetical protein
MGVDIYQDEHGYFFAGDTAILTSEEDPETFCAELLKVLTQKPPATELVDGLQGFINSGRRSLSREKVVALVNQYQDRVGDETPDGDE